MSAIHTDTPYARTDAAAYGAAVDEETRLHQANKVSWGGIAAGVAIALASQMTLALVGAGIGAGALDVGANASGTDSTSAFSIGTAAWSLGSVLVSTFLGGFVAARLSGRSAKGAAGLQGLTTWAVTTLLVVYLLTTSIGSILGGAFSGVASAIGGIGSTVAQTAAPALADANPLDAIENQVRSTGTDPEALQANAVNALRSLVTGGEAGAGEARQQAAQALSQARGIPLDQANQQVAEIERQYRTAVDSAKQSATEAAAATASIVSKGALAAALALVLGALAGWVGGRSGRVTPTVRRLA